MEEASVVAPPSHRKSSERSYSEERSCSGERLVPLGGDGVSNSVCGIEAVEKQRQSRRRRARIGRGLRRQGRGGEGGEVVEARGM